MKSNFYLTKKEKEEILRLHEQPESVMDRRYNIQTPNNPNTSNTNPVAPQQTLQDVVYALQRAYGGAGTNENLAYKTFYYIPEENFDEIITYLLSDNFKVGGNVGLVAAFNDEYGAFDLENVNNLAKLFKSKNSGYSITYDTSGLRGRTVSNIQITGQPNPNQKKDKKQEVIKKQGGQENTGSEESTKPKSSNSNDLTKRIQSYLQLPETGVMDQETINKAYAELSKR